MIEKYQYFAFISYKREDERWAKWLQNKLMHYKLPIEMRKKNTALPERVHPVFRDVTDLSGGVLEQAIKQALDTSKYLIVICSPRAVQSPWVSKEVQAFIDSGREEYIIPFIIDGEANSKDNTKECFPENLKGLSNSKEILGINIHEMGRDAAAIKVVARMFELHFDTLWQRYERSQKARRRWVVGLSLLGAIVAFAVAGVLFYQHRKMQINQARAVAQRATQLVEQGDSYLARRLLLEVLPDKNDIIPRPYVPEAEAAMRFAFNSNSCLLHGTKGDISDFRFSPNGQYVASLFDGGIVGLWNFYNGKTLRPFVCPANLKIVDFNFRDDVSIIISFDNSFEVIYNILGCYVEEAKEKGKSLSIRNAISAKMPNHNCLSISPSGRYAVLIEKECESEIILLNTDTLEPVRYFNNTLQSKIYNVVFSSDEKYIAFQSINVVIWDIQYGFWVDLNKELGEIFEHVVFDNNSNLITASWNYSTYENFIKKWRVQTLVKRGSVEVRNMQKICKYPNDAKYIWFSPMGDKCVLMSNDNKIWFRDLEADVPVMGLTNKTIISADDHNKRIIVKERGLKLGASEIWTNDGPENVRLKTLKYPNVISSDGKYAIVLVKKQFYVLELWDLQSVEKISELEMAENESALLPLFDFIGDNFIYTTYNRGFTCVKLWNWMQNCVCTVDEITEYMREHSFSKTGRYLSYVIDEPGSNNKNILKLFDIQSKELCILHQTEKYIGKVIFSPDEKYLIVDTEGEDIEIFDTSTKKYVCTLTCDMENLIFAPNGNYAIINKLEYYDEISFWNVKTQNYINPQVKVVEKVESVALSSKGRFWSVKILGDDSNFQLWDVENGQLINIYQGHRDSVNSIEFDINENYVVSTSDDNTIKIWDIISGKCIKTFIGHLDVVDEACFSRDNKYVISTASDKTVKIWDVESEICLHTIAHGSSRYYLEISPGGRYIYNMEEWMESKENVKLYEFRPLQELIDETRERFKGMPLTAEERREYYLE